MILCLFNQGVFPQGYVKDLGALSVKIKTTQELLKET